MSQQLAAVYQNEINKYGEPENCTSSTQICKKREDIERPSSMSFFE